MSDIIQRCDKSDGDAEGLDYLHIYTDLPGCSPIWSTKENAFDFENADEIAAKVSKKYGVDLVVGSNANEEKEDILRRMKSGELDKSSAIELLRKVENGGSKRLFAGRLVSNAPS